MRIGIFGGSFNPPHNAHKSMAISLIETGYLDKIIYVPVGNLYNKPYLANDADRYNMLKLMIEGYDYLEVSDYEFGQLTYTYQTLTHFKNQYPNDDICFICGSDNLKEFTTWREYKYVLSHFKIIVTKRNDDNIDEIINTFREYQNNILVTDINFDKDISSTVIRDKIKTNDTFETMADYVDKKVIDYIKNHQLYK